jgi:hypothetical protein
VQIVVADLDRDGRSDVAIRYLVSGRCSGGPHGCQTEVYRGSRRGFLNVRLYVVTVGHIVRCRSGASPGIRFNAGSQIGHCFAIR